MVTKNGQNSPVSSLLLGRMRRPFISHNEIRQKILEILKKNVACDNQHICCTEQMILHAQNGDFWAPRIIDAQGQKPILMRLLSNVLNGLA